MTSRLSISYVSGACFLIAALVVVPAPGWCQKAQNGTAIEQLANLRVGQWIQLEGTSPGTAAIACLEMRLLAGDFLDDDWSLRGTVSAIDHDRREFTIGGCRVRVSENTTYDNPRGGFTGFSDLRTGMVIEVEGTFLRDRRLLAAEVDDESDEVARQPRLKGRIELVGRIERMDPRHGLLTVMGIEFHVSAKTKLRSVIE